MRIRCCHILSKKDLKIGSYIYKGRKFPNGYLYVIGEITKIFWKKNELWVNIKILIDGKYSGNRLDDSHMAIIVSDSDAEIKILTENEMLARLI